MTNLRGTGLGDFGAAGPVASARRDGTLGDVGAYDARVEAGALTGDGLATTSFGRAGAGLVFARYAGPLRAIGSVRGVTDVVAQGPQSGLEGGGQARLALALPIERDYASSEPNDPLVHRLEPRVEVTALGSSSQNLVLDAPVAESMSGVGWVADGGVTTALGRWAAREAIEARVSAGLAGSDQQGGIAVVRWMAAASYPWLGLGAEGAHVLGSGLAFAAGTTPSSLVAGSPPTQPGYAIAARLRVGPLTSVHMGLLAAGREGFDPVLARALTDAPLPATMGFLAADGWTGGARLAVPLTSYLTARGGADADLSAKTLLGARGAIEFHDRCGCVVITANGAERVGRPGVDLWLAVNLVRR